MLEDDLVAKAVSKIRQRSEKQSDLEKLTATFVDTGILTPLENENNQIFYGRRGTGKTHVLRVLLNNNSNNQELCVTYIDSRMLGSTAQFSDNTIPLQTRCLALYRDIFSEIHDCLLDHIVEYPSSRQEEAWKSLNDLAASFTEPVKSEKPRNISKMESAENTAGTHIGIGIDPSGPKAEFKADTTLKTQTSATTEYDVAVFDKVIFPAVVHHLTDILNFAEIDLLILLDEWSSIPPDIQPYLAEFIKKSILPVTKATIKIASLEHRSYFLIPGQEPVIGFELGADISIAPDLDNYYVFDRNPDKITDAFASMLLQHLNAELPDNYLQTNHRITSSASFASRMFTERAVCKELARAAEGVARDLINIFSSAFFDAKRRGRTSIDKKAVTESARAWFEQDKQQYLDDHLQNVLRKIVDDVIGKRQARAFLVPRELQAYPTLQRLFDARVIHQMQHGYADKDNPGIRYNIYCLDYGTYIDLIGTSSQPQLDLEESDVDTTTSRDAIVVPFNDKRSIRRIILKEEIFS